MDKLLTQRKPLVALAALLCLVVIVAGWFLLIAPERQKVADLKAQVVQQESANDSTRSQIQALQALSAQLPQQRAKLAAISAKVPDKPLLPELVRLLSAAADESGVELSGITPTAPAAIDGAAGLQGIDVALKVSGSYVALEQYQLALEDLSRAFLVSGMQIQGDNSAAAPAAGSKAAGALTATINGRVLVGAIAPANSTATTGATAGATAATGGTTAPAAGTS